MEYNKLVRDNIPEIIKDDSQIPVTHIASKKEYKEKLKQKLQEEVNEFLDNPSKEELADIIEVINALSDLYEIDKEELELFRKKKLKKRGGFKKKIILEKIKE